MPIEMFFETLEPPPGGAAGLRDRLQREGQRSRRRVAILALAGALAVAGLLIALQGRPAPFEESLVAEVDPALVSLGLQDVPPEPAVIAPGMRHRMALQRVPLETDQVVFYYVAVLPSTPDSGEER